MWPTDSKGKYVIAFVGAGPGDPELITIKGKKLLEQADIVLYTGSLIPEALVSGLSADIINSASLTLEEVVSLLKQGFNTGKKIVRLHTGDPAIYSTIREQIRTISQENIPYFVVPGVTAGFAAAASLGVELTIPNKTQTVIFSRIAGRTPVPPNEKIESLAAIRASLILYLSVHKIDEVAKRLIEGGYPPETPVAVVEKVSWPDQKIIKGVLETITNKVQTEGIKKTAVILVGDAVGDLDSCKERSLLYHPGFSHAARKSESNIDLTDAFKELYIAFLTKRGEKLGKNIKSIIEYPQVNLLHFKTLKPLITSQKIWKKGVGLIFIMASGIAIRTIAQQIKSKREDPAVIVVDEAGKNVVSLLSGHLGGANKLCHMVADAIKARPVITTASDSLNLVPIDLWAKNHQLEPVSKDGLKKAASRLVSEGVLRIYSDLPIDELPPGLLKTSSLEEAELIISIKRNINISEKQIHLVPKIVAIGIGCHNHISSEHLMHNLNDFMKSHNLHRASISCFASIDRRRDTPALYEAARELNIPLNFFSSEDLGTFQVTTPSNIVENALGIKGVAEPSALLAAGEKADLLVPKQKYNNMTIAAAKSHLVLGSSV